MQNTPIDKEHCLGLFRSQLPLVFVFFRSLVTVLELGRAQVPFSDDRHVGFGGPGGIALSLLLIVLSPHLTNSIRLAIHNPTAASMQIKRDPAGNVVARPNTAPRRRSADRIAKQVTSHYASLTLAYLDLRVLTLHRNCERGWSPRLHLPYRPKHQWFPCLPHMHPPPR